MTLPNNFSTTKNKLAKIWEQTEANRVQINIQINQQQTVIQELDKTVIRSFENNQILNLDTAFVSPIVIKQNNGDKSQSIYQKWELSFTGLLIEEFIGCQVNLTMRFGSGGTYLDIPLSSFATIYIDKVFSMDSTTDSRDVVKKLLYGFYENKNSGLPEFDTNNMQLALNIRFPNPRYFN